MHREAPADDHQEVLQLGLLDHDVGRLSHLESGDIHVTGTLVWYYCICPREAWLMAHQINPDEDDPNIEYGRFLQRFSYGRERKEGAIGSSKVDIYKPFWKDGRN